MHGGASLLDKCMDISSPRVSPVEEEVRVQRAGKE